MYDLVIGTSVVRLVFSSSLNHFRTSLRLNKILFPETNTQALLA
jgi:hypothetical protein